MYREIYGVCIKVYISCDLTIQELGLKLEKNLEYNSFRYESLEDEPHDFVGYSEGFGFEVELKYLSDDKKWIDYNYLLTASSMDSLEEIFENRMHDVSPWMARFIARLCDVKTLVENPNKSEVGQVFYRNKITNEINTKLIFKITR